jgi:hypothetical protein
MFWLIFFAQAVSKEMCIWFTKNVDDYYRDDMDKLDHIMYRNALSLFPRLQKKLRTTDSVAPATLNAFVDESNGNNEKYKGVSAMQSRGEVEASTG